MRVKAGPSFKAGRTGKNAHSEHLLYACHFPYNASLQPYNSPWRFFISILQRMKQVLLEQKIFPK